MPGLIARFFGYPQIELDGAPLRIERHKAIAMLAYLGVSGQRLGRDTLASLFWPDYEASQANAYLRHTLWELRRALGEDRIEIDREAVGLVPGSGLWIDVVRFQELLGKWKAAAEGSEDHLRLLEEAVAFYRGDFLAGFTLRDSPDFDEWQSIQAEALRRRLAEGLAALVEARATGGEHERAITDAQRWLGLDRLDEAPHRALMRLYSALGQRGAALRQYEACARLLQEELGASPEPATTALYEEIRAGKLAPRREAAPPAPPLQRQAALPGDLTPFVGREEELAEIARLLADPECRLLTLVGPGGVGKTRLAVQAAGAQDYPDGVVSVSLAAQHSGEGLVGAIAEQFQPALRREGSAQPSPADARRQLLDYLRGRALLLVLDNVEHLATPVAGLLSELLPAAPRLKLLVTSRERLNLREEWVLEVHGLPYPGPGRAGNLADYAAVQLFLSIARRAGADLQLEPADWLAIAEICRSVEGMPLAIELAAPWVKLLSCPEIAAEIERNQDFLSSSVRGVPERHRSLRAVFEHSWHLLAERERDVFSRLSVFQGGFTREAAGQVAQATVADLAALIDKSLLRHGPTGRYDLHQVLKQYAGEKLALSPEAWGDAQARHATFYLEQLQAVGEGLKGREQRKVLALLEGDVENLRLAWQRALETGEWERIRRALPAWFLFLEMGPRRREGMDTIHWALPSLRAAMAGEGQRETLTAILAFLLATQRFFGMQLEPATPSRPLAEESLALVRTLPDCAEKALVFLLCSVGAATGSRGEGQTLSRQSLAVFEALGDRWGMAMAQLVWADNTSFGAGDLAAARSAYQGARAAFQALGNRWGEALCLVGLTHIAHQEKRYAEALELGRQSLAIYREMGNPWRIVWTLGQLAGAASESGDYAAARGYLEDTLSLLDDTGQRASVAGALVALGDVARKQDDLPAARGYLERALSLRRELDDRQGIEGILRSLAELGASGADSS